MRVVVVVIVRREVVHVAGRAPGRRRDGSPDRRRAVRRRPASRFVLDDSTATVDRVPKRWRASADASRRNRSPTVARRPVRARRSAPRAPSSSRGALRAPEGAAAAAGNV
mmetsp:Transcript_30387/g.91128  ORF Transcript_30387/g.91128 Transcript_30387/m.91128 type:complete len:110 (+) Transcript_30387:418-747(+)